MPDKSDSGLAKSDWNMTQWRIEDLAQLLRAITRFQYTINTGDKSVIRNYFSALKSLFFNLSTLMEGDMIEDMRKDIEDLDSQISRKVEENPEMAGKEEYDEIISELEDFDMELRQVMKEANLDFKKVDKPPEGQEILEGIFE